VGCLGVRALLLCSFARLPVVFAPVGTIRMISRVSPKGSGALGDVGSCVIGCESRMSILTYEVMVVPGRALAAWWGLEVNNIYLTVSCSIV